MLDVEATSELTFPDGRPVGVANFTSIATSEVAGNREVQALAQQLGQWVETARSGGRATSSSMFNRSLYVAPDNPYAQMRVARHAVKEDDVVSGIADATESLAFDGGLKWESSNPADADVFNQLSADLNLDAKIREIWRETFTVDQAVAVKLWDTVTYKVRGQTENGNKKKKTYDIYAPTQLTLLKPENVVPIGYGPLRKDRLAWQATVNEIGNYQHVIGSGTTDVDPLMSVFFTGQYNPGPDESAEMSQWGVNQQRLLSMNPDWVFRHTSTRPDYQKFPDIRLRSVFDLLDLKRQLIASDRATLIGAANYILLIRKGSKEQPATNDELANLKAGYNFLAKLPVIISDHRLEIDVIAPKLDFVLKKEAYEELNSRILSRCLSTFTSTARTTAGGSDIFGSTLATALQNRRHMIKRTLEREIAKAIVEHPRNKDLFEERPSLVFTPQTVAIGVNQFELQAMLALRTQREISRDTILEYMGLDQAVEAQRLEVEEKLYDPIFKTQIPFAAPAAGGNAATTQGPNAPAAAKPAPGPSGPSGATGAAKAPAKKATTPNGTPEAPAASGRRGGRPTGGGATANSPAKQAAPRSANGNKSN